MSLIELDLYSDLTPSYGSGTEDTGKGVGLFAPNPGFVNWQAYLATPNGITETPVGWWVHGSDFFMCYNGSVGLGAGIYRYSISNEGALTYQDFVAFGSLGFAGAIFSTSAWGQCAHYNSLDGTVIIVSTATSGTGNTPIVKKWDCADWPFTSSNHLWASPLAQSYGSFVSGELAYVAVSHRIGGRFFMTSQYAGQVITLDDSDGSVDGVWEYYAAYNTSYPFCFLGVDSSGNPYGGSYHASGGNKDLWKWDITNLNSWSPDTKIMEDTGSSGYPHSPAFKRAICDLYGGRYRPLPLSSNELSALGWSGQLAWYVRVRQTGYGEWILCLYDPATDAYTERPVAEGSVRRALGNSSYEIRPTFILIDGVNYSVSFSEFSLDIENDNPGGIYPTQIGFVFCPIGPGYVIFEGTASALTPKRMLITVEKTAVNYLGSESYQKHGFAFENVTQATGVGDYRYGVQELSHLDEAINGKSIWPAIDAGDTIKIYHQLESGWPRALDPSFAANPGESGDPTSPEICTADFGPPREVRPILFASSSLPDEGKTYGKAGGGTAINMRPGAGVAYT